MANQRPARNTWNDTVQGKAGHSSQTKLGARKQMKTIHTIPQLKMGKEGQHRMTQPWGKKNDLWEGKNQRHWRSGQVAMLTSERQHISSWFKVSTCLSWLPASDSCWLGPTALAYKFSLPLLLVIGIQSSLSKNVPSGKTPHSGIEEKAEHDLVMTIQCLYRVVAACTVCTTPSR